MANCAAQTAARPSLRTQDYQLGPAPIHELGNRGSCFASANEANRDTDPV